MTTFSAPRPRPSPSSASGDPVVGIAVLFAERWWRWFRSVVTVLHCREHLSSVTMIKIKFVLTISYTTVLLTATALSNTW